MMNGMKRIKASTEGTPISGMNTDLFVNGQEITRWYDISFDVGANNLPTLTVKFLVTNINIEMNDENNER